jgi:hypothetical protein
MVRANRRLNNSIIKKVNERCLIYNQEEKARNNPKYQNHLEIVFRCIAEFKLIGIKFEVKDFERFYYE